MMTLTDEEKQGRFDGLVSVRALNLHSIKVVAVRVYHVEEIGAQTFEGTSFMAEDLGSGLTVRRVESMGLMDLRCDEGTCKHVAVLEDFERPGILGGRPRARVCHVYVNGCGHNDLKCIRATLEGLFTHAIGVSCNESSEQTLAGAATA